MWVAVDFTADRRTRAPFADDTVKTVVRRMKEGGVLASGIGVSAFEMAPPLISERAHLDRAVAAAAEAVRAVAKERGLG
jgi:putrescine aminotransferase